MPDIPAFRPTCEVDFHSERGFYSSRGQVGDTYVSGQTPTADFLSVSTSKALSAAAGTFSVSFPAIRDSSGLTWYDKVEPMDMVVIKMQRPPLAKHTVMVGFVDDIRERYTVGGDGRPQKSIVITGRDFGKAFLKACIRYFPEWLESGQNKNPFGPQFTTMLKGFGFLYTGQNVRGTPARLVKMLIENVLDAVFSVNVSYWDGGKSSVVGIKDILGFRLGKFAVDFTTPEFDEALKGFEGAVWNYLQLVGFAPFMEMFVDTRNAAELMSVHVSNDVELDSHMRGGSGDRHVFGDSKVVLFTRRTPFDKERWEQLMTHDITPSEISSWEAGRNDHQKFTGYSVFPEAALPGIESYSGFVYPKLTSVDEVRKFGLNVLDAQMRGFIYDTSATNQLNALEAADYFQNVLERWYRNNHRYENGQAVLRGNPFIHIGQRVRRSDTGRVYYVEEVAQNFVRFGPFTTRLTLTRGQPSDGSWFGTPTRSVTTFREG